MLHKIFAGIALAALVLASPLHAETIRVGYIPVGDCLQLYVAQEQGYLEAEGITVETTPLAGGALIAMAVEAGELDVGWSNLVSLAIAADKGFGFVILSPGAFELEDSNRVHSILVAKDASIANFADLEGKTVAINTLGNINEIAMNALADAEGVDIAKIRLVEVPFPQMGAALASGSVDAILVLEPFVTITTENGTAKVLEPAALKSYGERFLIAAWFAQQSWIEENKEAAAGFRRAMLKASQYIEDNPKKARDVLTRHTKLTAELAQTITLPYFGLEATDADIQPLLDLPAKYGFIAKPLTATQLRGK